MQHVDLVHEVLGAENNEQQQPTSNLGVSMPQKTQQAQGLNITSEELRKFIASPPSARDSNNMLRLEILGPQNNKQENEDEEEKDELDKGEHEEEERVVSPSIWEAAKQGNVALVRQVIEDQGKEIVNTRDPETETTLLYTTVAHVRQPESMLRLLVENGAEPDAPSVYGIRALHALPIHCARPLPSMQLLLDHHADINARDGDNWTPLHYAARFCKEPDTIVRQLVSRGANVNAVDANGKSPLFALLANGDHASTLGWLIHSAKADVTIKGEFLLFRPTPGTILLQTAKYARLECMKLLVQSPAAMDQLRTAITCHELNLATVMLRKRLEKQDPSSAVQTDELLEIVEELRRTLEEDANSTVAYEIYMERTGRQAAGTLPRRRTTLLGTIKRSASKKTMMSQSSSASSADHRDSDTCSKSGIERKPTLMRRVFSVMSRQQKEHHDNTQ
ncbi:hypothetical protein O0I10_010806 [Lichtheimia ornata]|uniref:Ankyrin n=1 Tax=Lichtheimia ornata TaxID=688661 RepID=A0AAD7UUZ9_9FUNG|nr:uncharacterized protein O0I10_010806 [Lichtheimia ornata]KAJ8653566.1 hypothetical protein O0I10_010806 [Lichtheimia ornata]